MTHTNTRDPQRVVIAGGGVGGLEALLALHALAGERVATTLVAPEADFVHRPLAVAEPFSAGRRQRIPLSEAVRAAGAARHTTAALHAVDPDARTITTSAGELEYDALLVAVGAKPEPAFRHAITWDDRASADVLGGLLRDVEGGYTKRLAVVVPPGPGWPLPAYELALLISRAAEGMAAELSVTLVTPEQAPLAAFGARATEAVARELEEAGVAVETGAYAEVEPGAVLMRPAGRRLDVDRVVALPRLGGHRIAGLPADADGFLEVDEHCRVRGIARVWGAGDGIAFPIKFGGLAAGQADAAAEDIAVLAGATLEAQPFRPVLRGHLLTGLGRPGQYLRFDASGGAGDGEAAPRPLWWPPGKVAGRYLSPWLAARDGEAVADHLPHVGGVPVQTDLGHSFTSG